MLTTYEMRSALWQHLRSQPHAASRHTDLTAEDYRTARYIALAERDPFSRAHRHAHLSDVEEYSDAALLDDVAAYLSTGDEAAKERGWQRLCDALTASANVTIDNRLRELRALRMSGSRTTPPPECVPFRPDPDDHHAHEIEADRRAADAEWHEQRRDYVSEQARR